MANVTETREEIKDRMLGHISAIWGLKNPDVIDPVVKILIEALSGELQKTRQEMLGFENRILEKISSLVTPDILSLPQCAHGIVHARPTEKTYTIGPDTILKVKNRIRGTEVIIDVPFSPVRENKLIDGAVKFMVSGNRLIEIGQQFEKKSRTLSGYISEPNVIWIGIECEEPISSRGEIKLFIDLQEITGKSFLLEMFQNGAWNQGSNILKSERGFGPISDGGKDAFYNRFDPLVSIEKDVLQFYTSNFIRLSGFDGGVSTPNEISSLLKIGESSPDQQKKLNWISVEIRQELNEKILQNLIISLNSFPVLNRYLKEVVHRFKGLSAIVPVETGKNEYFLSVKKVSDNENTEYYNIAKPDNSNFKPTYSVRKKGAERVDERSASEYLNYLLEIVRDEQSVFSGFGQEISGNLINDLDKLLTQLEQRLRQIKSNSGNSAYYISIDSVFKTEMFFIQYWLTNGSIANNISPGSLLISEKGSAFGKNSLMLLTTTLGGRDQRKTACIKDAFKYSILTKDRLITAEDLSAFCHYELGELIESVEVSRSYMVSESDTEGMVKFVEVKIRKKDSDSLSDSEWSQLLIQTENKMKSRASLNLIIKVRCF